MIRIALGAATTAAVVASPTVGVWPFGCNKETTWYHSRPMKTLIITAVALGLGLLSSPTFACGSVDGHAAHSG